MLGKRDLHRETREGIDLSVFKPVFGRICSREAKTKFRQCDWSAKKFAAKKLDRFLLFYLSLRYLVLQHGAKPCKVSIALFVDYSSTIRGLFVLFVDYSRTIRTIHLLFAVYSYYSSTIRTIRFTILVLSITA